MDVTRPDATYDYGLAVKGRFIDDSGEKTFLWRRKDAETWGALKPLKESDLPLYGDLTGDTIYLCEGEKAVDACLSMGLSAACLPGGAGATKFGSALIALEGKRVILWPDNDDAGRVLMRRVRAAIDGTATVLAIAPKLPEKGDAFDYFVVEHREIGELETLAASANLEAYVEETEDGYVVHIPDIAGAVRFEIVDIEERPRDLSALITVRQDIPGMSREPFNTRINVLSASALDGVRRSLDDMYQGPKGYWTGLLNKMSGLFREAHQQRDWSIDLDTVETEMSVPYLLHPLIIGQGHTILYGPGGTGKTYVALAMAVVIASGTHQLGYQGTAQPVIFVDYEADARQIKRRVLRLADGMGITLSSDFFRTWFIYWPGRGSLVSMVPALKRRVERGAGFVVVDSAALACGGNPKDEDTALNYFGGLRKLGIPSLTLAHQTKDEKADDYPYGSIFWHTSARATWNIKTPEESKAKAKEIGLYNRKSNEDAQMPAVGMVLEFGDDWTRVTKGSLAGELAEYLALSKRIRQVLVGSGKLTTKQIAVELGVKKVDTIYRSLKRMEDAMMEGERGNHNSLWFIVSSDVSDEDFR